MNVLSVKVGPIEGQSFAICTLERTGQSRPYDKVGTDLSDWVGRSVVSGLRRSVVFLCSRIVSCAEVGPRME